MAINDEELLAAVTGGVDAAAATVQTPETNANEPDDADADSSLDGGEDGAGESGNEADLEPTGESASDVDADGAGEPDAGADTELDADGKPVAKAAKKPEADDTLDPETGKPWTPEQVAARKDKADKEAFQKLQIDDPINAPIPKYLRETTQKRMVSLVNIAKDLTTKHEAAMKDRNEIIGMITDTGANAQQYRGVLNYLSLVNSGEPEKIKQAISVMQQELQILSRAAGIPVVGVDHLAEHADLIGEVAAGKLTPERAQEIAVTRNRTKFHTERQTQHTQTTAQQQEQARADHAQGIADLNSIGAQLEAAEGTGYRAKAKVVLKSIEAKMAKTPPREWGQMFLVAYTTHKPPAAVAPPVRKPVVPKNQPLRGNNPSGGQQKAPASFEDAVNMGIAAGTRR